MTDEEIIANRDKRPRYQHGQRVQIAIPDSQFDGWQGVVRSITPMQTVVGYVLTYDYRLEMDNLAAVTLLEDQLQPCDAPDEEVKQPLREIVRVVANGYLCNDGFGSYSCPFCDVDEDEDNPRDFGDVPHDDDCIVTWARKALAGEQDPT